MALTSGGAYLRSSRATFYFAGGRAQPVEGLPAEGVRDVVALADGSALARAAYRTEPRLFWLRGARAVEVVEGEAVAASLSPQNNSGFYFAEIQRLRNELEEAHDEIASLEAALEPAPEVEPE